MRLLPWAALRRDRKQFIYNWMLEDDLDLEQGNWKEAKRTRGIADNPVSHARSRSAKKAQGNKRALLCKPSRDVDSRKLPCQSCQIKVGKEGSGTKGHLCKPKSWCGFMQTNPGSHVGSRSSKGDTGEQGHRMQIGRIHTETESQAWKNSRRKRKEKGNRENTE